MNNNQDSNMPSVPLTFKFKGLIAASIVICTMALFFWCLTWFAMRQPDSSIGLVLFFFITSIFICIVGFIFINSRADLVIDDQGISRHLFGKIWQKILWDDVQVIKVFPMFDGKASRGFNIIPSVGSKLSFMPKGKISFLDRAEKMDELIGAMNYYISLHNIKVEVKRRDQMMTSTHIER